VARLVVRTGQEHPWQRIVDYWAKRYLNGECSLDDARWGMRLSSLDGVGAPPDWAIDACLLRLRDELAQYDGVAADDPDEVFVFAPEEVARGRHREPV
jgi:hypothetical protein